MTDTVARSCPRCWRAHKAGGHTRNAAAADGRAAVLDTAADPPGSCGTCCHPATVVEGTQLCVSHGAAAEAEQAQLRQLLTTHLIRLGVGP